MQLSVEDMLLLMELRRMLHTVLEWFVLLHKEVAYLNFSG